MKAPSHILAMLPFSGFYETQHEVSMDHAVEFDLADSSGDPNPDLLDRACDTCVFFELRKVYARAYADHWMGCYRMPVTFSELRSPREYNFETDKILVWIPLETVTRMFAETPAAIMDDIARDLFTPRSGFMPYYSANWREWSPIAEWAPAQVYALILAWVRAREESDSGMLSVDEFEAEVSEGMIETLCETLGNFGGKYARLSRIASYLREREDRQWGTC